MKTSTIGLGICKNARCNVDGNTPVERYDGPGMFCPNCGELLQAYDADETKNGSWYHPSDAVADEEVAMPEPASNTPLRGPSVSRSVVSQPKRSPVLRRLLAGVLSVAALLVVAVVVVAGTIDRAHASPFNAIGICGSSMTERLARDVASAYAAGHASAEHFEIRSVNCDVRFAAIDAMQLGAASRSAKAADILDRPIASDAVVAIVNPQNPISVLGAGQLRDLMSGVITRWSAAGGADRLVTVYLPNDTTDESRMISSDILRGMPVSPSVVRLPSTADVVRAVTAANGRDAVGFVAFSQAVPGKVVAIKNYAPPSILSISQQRYPFTIGIAAQASSMNQTWVPGLLKFASSESAKAIAIRDGYVQ